MTSPSGHIEEVSAHFANQYSQLKRRHCRHVIKVKENKFKPKCSKCYKRKFKKYKLRRDGKEDQDVLDVSQILLSSLRIKSPRKGVYINKDLDNLKPKNYLFKMVKQKHLLCMNNNSNSSFETSLEEKETQESPDKHDKKHTNAFKLLMDSRNKSIGSNSPGKEKSVDDAEVQQLLEKKNAKVKRTLMLQKMAEGKGSLKKKALEEQQDRLIKKKMDKRAERLKSMILNKEPKAPKVDEQQNSNNKSRDPLNIIDTHKNNKNIEKPKKTFQIINMFSDTITNGISPEKPIPREDAEFLNKLSPSLKKKESMLSYFKKIDKDEEKSINVDDENDNTVIKVKFTPSLKKKGRRKKRNDKVKKQDSDDKTEDPNLPVADDNELVEVFVPIIEEDIAPVTPEKNEKRKRKRDLKDIIYIDTPAENGERPKRNVKKPQKYVDDLQLTSSDEELHIFTPKKKKHSDNKIPVKVIDVNINDNSNNVKEQKKSSKKEKKTKIYKEMEKEPVQPKTLAPIFRKNLSDPAAVEAKQKFLQSGVPEQLKKLMTKQKNTNVVNNDFLKVVHVQQFDSQKPVYFEYPTLKDADDSHDVNISGLNQSIFKELLSPQIKEASLRHSYNYNSVQVTLKHLKDLHIRFPVYRTYRLLRSKKKGEFKDNTSYLDLHNSVEIVNCSIDEQSDNPEQLNWCDKYKPLTFSQIIGNFDSNKELKKWLVSWTENQIKSKACKTAESSDSSDFCYSDTDSRENVKSSNNNLLILCGPVGCGKTSSVYAVAAELSIKVIEVNVSSKRTGKIVLQDLQEATQSHKVNRGTTSTENSQSSQKSQDVVPKVKKRGRKKKQENLPSKSLAKEPCSQENTRTGMSLILIDDADVVFDQDDGFCSAISQLVCSSKRPVILITSSLSCLHLQKFIQTSKILTMNSLLPSMLGTWLDIMCLADIGVCSPGTGAKFLDYFKGDIRKAINCLQFYISSQDQPLNIEDTCSQNIENGHMNNEDENSNMSWIDHPLDSIKQFDEFLDKDFIWQSFKNNQINTNTYRSSTELFNMWWSVPKLLGIEAKAKKVLRNPNKNDKDSKLNETSLESLSVVLDTISACDFQSLKGWESNQSVSSSPWYNPECDSVSELENLTKYDKIIEIENEISHELLTRTFGIAQNKLGLEKSYDLDFPGMSVHREKSKKTSRHMSLNSAFNPQAILDRKALALDYWAACRAICRTEKTKTDSNFKRNNRFCHYLKPLGIHCKNDSYDNLADSLCNSETNIDKS